MKKIILLLTFLIVAGCVSSVKKTEKHKSENEKSEKIVVTVKEEKKDKNKVIINIVEEKKFSGDGKLISSTKQTTITKEVDKTIIGEKETSKENKESKLEIKEKSSEDKKINQSSTDWNSILIIIVIAVFFISYGAIQIYRRFLR